MKAKLSEALGEERWAQVQRSSIKEQIRNCMVGDVTIDELISMAKLFNVNTYDLTRQLSTGNTLKIFSVEDFGSEEEWIEGMSIPKRD